LAHAVAVFAESKTSIKPDGVRPTMRTGFLGLVGSKFDMIDHCNEKIKELLPKLEAEQNISLQDKQQRAALVFFNSRAAATVAAQTIHAQMIDTWIVTEAPNPRAVIWPNLSMRLYMRQIRQVIVYAVVFLTVVFYMIPISFISALTTLANLERLAPFLKTVVDRPELKTVLEAYFPQLVLIIFLALLPSFLMFLSKSEGIPSESHAVRAAAGKYFYFFVFNVFIGVTITGTLWSSLKSIINHPSEIVDLLAKSLPGNATFFLTFVALK
jgi:calcium permeable stress-gated cation channel